MNPYSKTKPEQITRTVSDWYRSYVPPMYSNRFPRFASRSHVLAEHAAQTDNKLKIEFKDAPTAYVDLKTRIITMPKYYLSEMAMMKILENDEDRNLAAAAIACINGSMLHEGLHLRYTTINPEDAMKRDEATVKAYGKQTAAMAINIGEDLFIESQMRMSDDHAKRFIEMKDAILMSEADCEKALDAAFAARDTDNEAAAGINALVMLKNTTNRDNERWSEWLALAEAKRYILQSENTTIQTTRIECAMKALRCFKKPETPPADDGGKSVMGAPTPDGEELMMLVIEEDAEAVEGVIAEIEKAMKDFEEHRNEAAVEEKLQVFEIEKFPSMDKNGMQIETHSFDTFARLIKQLKTKNHAPGQPRMRGSKIVNTRISRIATDQKIFAVVDGEISKRKVEVIILGDASGSMRHGGRWQMAHSACSAVFAALRKAGVSSSVYFHTSIGDEIPALIHAASYQMRTTTADPMGKISLAHDIALRQNFDGVAIAALKTRFSGRPARRVVIVISDGEPSGGNYYGEMAMKHTKTAINDLRKSGISVICFSIDSGVVAKNDGLYGKENNVGCADEDALDIEFKKVIGTLVKEESR
jgi:Mg-chelatase subunit ChlD